MEDIFIKDSEKTKITLDKKNKAVEKAKEKLKKENTKRRKLIEEEEEWKMIF